MEVPSKALREAIDGILEIAENKVLEAGKISK